MPTFAGSVAPDVNKRILLASIRFTAVGNQASTLSATIFPGGEQTLLTDFTPIDGSVGPPAFANLIANASVNVNPVPVPEPTIVLGLAALTLLAGRGIRCRRRRSDGPGNPGGRRDESSAHGNARFATRETGST